MMDPQMSEWLNLILRWIHVIAGIVWIGHLYFFNFVNAQLAKTYDADSKKKVVPELMPRALYWFRWGAVWTWVSGLFLLFLIYYHGGALLEIDSGMSPTTGMLIGLAVLLVGFAAYDILWSSPLKANVPAGTALSFVLLAAVTWWLAGLFSGRAVFIHVGALLGTIMAANVWMRIWPAQRKIIAAIKAGQAPDAALVATAGLRSRQNTYNSVPLTLLMVSNHYPLVYGQSNAWLIAMLLVLVGWGGAWWMFKRSGSAAAAKF